MVRAYWAIRTRQAAGLVARGRSTALIEALSVRLGGVEAHVAVRHAVVLAALLGGGVDAHGLSRIRQTTAGARIGRSRSHIQRHSSALRAAGVLVVHAAPRESDDAGNWSMSGPNGYELSPDLLDELAAAENPQPANGNGAAGPTQPRDYRGVSIDAPSPSDSRRPARDTAGLGPPGHCYADDGHGLCITCELPARNRRHALGVAA